MIDFADSTCLVPTTVSVGPLSTVDQSVGNLLSLWASGLAPTSRSTYSACLLDFARFARADTVDQAVDGLLQCGRQAAKALCLAYRADLFEVRGLSPSTTNLRLAALRSLVAFAEDFGKVDWLLTCKPVKSRILRDTSGPGRAAIRKMHDQVADRGDAKGLRDAAIVRTFFDLGLRRAELAGLDMSDVDLVTGRLRILGKGRTEHEWVTLPTPTAKVIEAWITARGDHDGPLFVSLANRSKGKRISGNGLWGLIRSLGKSAAGVRTSPHRLRHSSITTACEAETDLHKVKRFSRHASVEMIGHYHDNLADAGGEVAKLVAELL